MALEGTTLKGWVLGKKLGSGACSDVYAVDSVAPLADKTCDAFVMKLSPLVTIDAAKAKNKKRKKSAAERNADALYAEHLLYQSHLREHPSLPYIPPGAYGEDKGYRFLVMERLGRTLEAVLRENGPIPSTTAAQLGLSLLDALQYIHSKNIVYVDVKPENFMLDREKEHRVYFVDFGIAERYVMATGKHKEHKTGTVVGTPTFLSLNCHAGATASRRDDVEALLNVLIYLMRGDLPWQQASSDAEGAKMKRDTSITDLCKSLPTEWAVMLTKARSHEFEDKPDYDFFSQQFVKLGAKASFSGPFVWSSKTQKSKAQSKPGASPTRKKSKSGDATPPPVIAAKDAAPPPPIKVKTDTKAKPKDVKPPAVTEKTEMGKRPGAQQSAGENGGRSTAKKSAKTVIAKKKLQRDEESDEEEEVGEEEEDASAGESDGSDGVEFVKTAGKDPRRRRKAAAKAVAAAAAAEAAAKQAEGTGRYQLRSSTKV